ncbi:helix-turn-helix transcriptional regulator [Prauserella endophytica]|uniref:DNA-binding protein n=1 Tax=Prauserella endophytica TaxID=1592324 RepID=A0ABY2RUY7_9PSEU|nr:hypothetical protein [Prauserella endophytica]TKG61521.1 hypothetical protein FCN18_33315 [Prauserella endophytica]
MSREYIPIANGTSTDHPYPNIPFVDDTHLPLDDPDAIEAMGRGVGDGRWGRSDTGASINGERYGAWAATTNDEKNPKYVWCVLNDADYGRSVLLFHAAVGSIHDDYWFERPRTFLRRRGGYWWNGSDWYRPRQVIDWSTETYDARQVRKSTTILAADLLDSTADPARGKVYQVLTLEPHAVDTGQWRHDLARWARSRAIDSRPLDQCIVTVEAPEFDHLLTLDEVAETVGIEASTLRAYITRDEADVPTPQDTSGGRMRWAKPVINDWVERRRRDDVGRVLSRGSEDLSPHLQAMWDLMSKNLENGLRRSPTPLKRREDPHRVARELGWTAALVADKPQLSADTLRMTVEYAVLYNLRDGLREERWPGDYCGFPPQIEQLLGWFVQRHPGSTPQLFGSIIQVAKHDFNVGEAVTANSLRRATRSGLAIAGFEEGDVDDYLHLALPPSMQKPRSVN